ncbi:uncharacterized protein tnxba [Pholidichthys leucotaenia]
MLFILGLLLLTPFPSFQTTTNEKRDTTGRDLTKPSAVFSLSNPKTTASSAKQTDHPTLKPNAVNQIVLPSPVTNQKPPTVNATATTKSKPSSTVIKTTSSAATRAATTIGTITNKDKHTASVNQTVFAKSPSPSDVKTSKDKHVPTPAPNIHLTSTKSASVSSTKITKHKPQSTVNQIVSVKPPSAKDGKTAKDKPAPTVAQNVQSTPTTLALTNSPKTTKNKLTASVNQTVVAKSPPTTDVKSKDKPETTKAQTVLPTTAPAKTTTAVNKDEVTTSSNETTSIKDTSSKEKLSPLPPVKVVIKNECDSNNTKEQELKPGAPLVMMHKISLVPSGCDGKCEDEMALLKERVARLEREMSLLKDKCPCSANCPNDCSDNGECERGKCLCQEGFTGPDCSKCAQGSECSKKASKGKASVTVETVTLQVNKDKEKMQEKNTKVERTLFHKKDPEAQGTDGKHKVATTTKAGDFKTQTKQDASVKKTTIKTSSTTTKTSRPTVNQVLLTHVGRKQEEEARKGKTTILATEKHTQKTDTKLDAHKETPKSDQLRDEPRTNKTLSNVKKTDGRTKIVNTLSKVAGANKTRTGKESLEQSTLAEKNGTQLSGHKQIKTAKVDTVNTVMVQSIDNKKTEASKTGTGKVTQKSQYVVNTTTVTTSDKTKVLQNKTIVYGSTTSTKRTGGGLGSVKVGNISSYSFTVMWSAPQGMFKNFTVIRRESWTEGDEHEDFEEEGFEGEMATAKENTTEVLVQSEGTNSTSSSGKTVGSKGKAETRKISMVLPGNVRSVEFSNLRASTPYILHIYGTTAQRRSKIHRVAATTGPQPATEMDFSNVTESSLTVSWSKPKSMFTGYKVTYTNIITGESRFVTVNSQQSHVVLSGLSAGSSYIITVTTTRGQSQSDMLSSIITTVPAPPTHLQVINVTDTRAVLKWTPSLGKVDRFLVSYESSKTPNVTVTVMLSGTTVEHQLRGLQRGTLYKVKVLSQKDSLQSMAISTTFTTANVVKASEVGARSAVITWRSTVLYHSYRIIYHVAGHEAKEVILEPTVKEYKLTGLLPMSRYSVLVQGEKDRQYTSVITTEFITGKLRFPFPTECSQELLNGALHSGEVDIYPEGKDGPAVRVYCDMEADGGGWTVFQRRMNGKTNFYRTWSEYRTGFGNLSEEFWLGNELLHNLTSAGPVSLRVDMRYGNESVYAQYANFSIDSEDRKYALTVSGYTGTAGDSMRYHNSRPFSTRDKDPGSLGIHCAKAYMGGWWYKNCYKVNLNGLYGINSNNQGIVWIDWKGKDFSIPFTEMKFRPSRFSPATHG